MRILITALFVLISIAGYSQKYSVHKLRAGTFNGDTRKFDLKESYVLMGILINKDSVYVSDYANSVYKITDSNLEQSNDSIVVVSHNAIDEKNRKCSIFVRNSKKVGDSYIVIVYSNYILQYFISDIK
jgi:hypothetical protein